MIKELVGVGNCVVVVLKSIELDWIVGIEELEVVLTDSVVVVEFEIVVKGEVIAEVVVIASVVAVVVEIDEVEAAVFKLGVVFEIACFNAFLFSIE